MRLTRYLFPIRARIRSAHVPTHVFELSWLNGRCLSGMYYEAVGPEIATGAVGHCCKHVWEGLWVGVFLAWSHVIYHSDHVDTWPNRSRDSKGVWILHLFLKSGLPIISKRSVRKASSCHSYFVRRGDWLWVTKRQFLLQQPEDFSWATWRQQPDHKIPSALLWTCRTWCKQNRVTDLPSWLLVSIGFFGAFADANPTTIGTTITCGNMCLTTWDCDSCVDRHGRTFCLGGTQTALRRPFFGTL